jgi:hypothetical protein
MKITTDKNWYLVWLTALLLLCLGKVYEWAYPSFQHDQAHFIKNALEKEIEHFLQNEKKQAALLQQSLSAFQSGNYSELTLSKHFINALQDNQILCINNQIRYWKGKNPFFDTHWCVETPEKSITLFSHYGEYYYLKQSTYVIDSAHFRIISYSALNSINSCKQNFEITTQKKDPKSLSIYSGTNSRNVLAYFTCLFFYYFICLFIRFPEHFFWITIIRGLI